MEMEMKELGFGTMRLSVLNQGDSAAVGSEQICQMMDTFMKRGFTHSDTAHIYHKYESGKVVKRALIEHWPREWYVLANKLPLSYLKEEADMKRFFREQPEECGVAYFDHYMPHNISGSYYETTECLGILEFMCRKKKGGKVRGTGSSFHVDTEFLGEILERHPEVDFAQLQLNYTGWDNPNIQSRQHYEVCRGYREDITVIKPVKGGTLAHIFREAGNLMEAHAPGMTPAFWAVRFAASREGVIMVLSGVSNYSQLLNNTAYMQGFVPLTEGEEGIVGRAAEIIQSATAISYISCQYCVEEYLKQIPIPKYFSLYNQHGLFGEKSNSRGYYQNYADRYRKAKDCIGYRRYEAMCPQHLPVIQHMKEIAEVFGPAK